MLEELKNKERQNAEANYEQQCRKSESGERRKRKAQKGKSTLKPLSQLENLRTDEWPKCHLDVDCQWICDNCNICHMHCITVSPDIIPDMC